MTAGEGAQRPHGGAPPDRGTLLTVWGAGGSAPTGRAARGRFGGDTVCFEIRSPDPDQPPLVIDLGSAARDLGRDIVCREAEAGRPARVEVLLGHLHLDHVIGLPFFAPLYDAEARVTLRCGVMAGAGELERTLGLLASQPFFPVRPLELGAARYRVFEPGDTLHLCGFRIRTLALNHPGGCCGFRIEGPDGAICIVGDHEHGDARIDAAVRAFVEGAEIMLYDAAYDDAEYECYRGWGHSTWQKGVALAEAAGVELALFHHHQPDHDDDALEALDARVRARRPGARLARQGMTARITKGAVEID